MNDSGGRPRRGLERKKQETDKRSRGLSQKKISRVEAGSPAFLSSIFLAKQEAPPLAGSSGKYQQTRSSSLPGELNRGTHAPGRVQKPFSLGGELSHRLWRGSLARHYFDVVWFFLLAGGWIVDPGPLRRGALGRCSAEGATARRRSAGGWCRPAAGRCKKAFFVFRQLTEWRSTERWPARIYAAIPLGPVARFRQSGA